MLYTRAVDRCRTAPARWPGLGASRYTLVNLAGSYDLGHGVTAFARIDNLLDRHYQDPIGFLHQGLGVFGGVKVAIDAASWGG